MEEENDMKGWNSEKDKNERGKQAGNRSKKSK